MNRPLCLVIILEAHHSMISLIAVIVHATTEAGRVGLASCPYSRSAHDSFWKFLGPCWGRNSPIPTHIFHLGETKSSPWNHVNSWASLRWNPPYPSQRDRTVMPTWWLPDPDVSHQNPPKSPTIWEFTKQHWSWSDWGSASTILGIHGLEDKPNVLKSHSATSNCLIPKHTTLNCMSVIHLKKQLYVS